MKEDRRPVFFHPSSLIPSSPLRSLPLQCTSNVRPCPRAGSEPASRPVPHHERSCMALDWAPFVDFVRAGQRFLLTTHVRPDADGLGSMLALAETLRRRDKQVQMVVASSLPPRYGFLDPQRSIERFTLPGERW